MHKSVGVGVVSAEALVEVVWSPSYLSFEDFEVLADFALGGFVVLPFASSYQMSLASSSSELPSLSTIIKYGNPSSSPFFASQKIFDFFGNKF